MVLRTSLYSILLSVAFFSAAAADVVSDPFSGGSTTCIVVREFKDGEKIEALQKAAGVAQSEKAGLEKRIEELEKLKPSFLAQCNEFCMLTSFALMVLFFKIANEQLVAVGGSLSESWFYCLQQNLTDPTVADFCNRLVQAGQPLMDATYMFGRECPAVDLFMN